MLKSYHVSYIACLTGRHLTGNSNSFIDVLNSSNKKFAFLALSEFLVEFCIISDEWRSVCARLGTTKTTNCQHGGHNVCIFRSDFTSC